MNAVLQTMHQAVKACPSDLDIPTAKLLEKYSMNRDIHSADVSLFVAASLRGFGLTDSASGRGYRVERGSVVIYTAATFKEVANLCGALGRTTLREAAERDGLKWPASAEAFSAAMKNP